MPLLRCPLAYASRLARRYSGVCPASTGNVPRPSPSSPWQRAQLWEIAELPPGERAGIWHLAGPEALSRYALGSLIATALNLPTERLRWGLSRDAGAPRPRDLRLLTPRADAHLRTRARPISLAAAMALAAAGERG